MGLFHDQLSVMQPVGSKLVEIDDGWLAEERGYFSGTSMKKLEGGPLLPAEANVMLLPPIH